MEPARLLIVEDDPGIGGNLDRALTTSGYVTTWVQSVAGALDTSERPDLVLLDLGLPDGDGLEVARALRHRWSELPIIVLTARTEEMDVVVGLDAGAIDYVTKPFRLAELLAHVHANLRRGTDVDRPTQVTDGDLTIDLDARRVVLGGAELELRAKEYDLLVELISSRGKVVTHEDLMSNVWDEHWFGSTKTLDVHIAALRRRLGEAPGDTSRITSLRGVGYRWEPAESGS